MIALRGVANGPAAIFDLAIGLDSNPAQPAVAVPLAPLPRDKAVDVDTYLNVSAAPRGTSAGRSTAA